MLSAGSSKALAIGVKFCRVARMGMGDRLQAGSYPKTALRSTVGACLQAITYIEMNHRR
jgi:hypothetical protein